MRIPLPVRAIPAVAEKVWWSPPRSGRHTLDHALSNSEALEEFTLEFGDRELRGFTGGDGPAVVLIHGWGGQAAQFRPVAEGLIASGHSVYALDLPGHGSDTQRTSDAFQMGRAVARLVDTLGGAHAIVGHSLAAMSLLVAGDTVELPPRVVLIAPLLDATHATATFSDRARLFPWTRARLAARFRRFVGVEWWPRMTQGASIDLGTGEVLLVHDRDDSETPFDTAAALAGRRPNTRLHATDGLGHNRILSDPEVVTVISEFVGTTADHLSSA